MTKWQKRLIVINFIIASIILLYVPWMFKIDFDHHFTDSYSLGYHPIWNPPALSKRRIKSVLEFDPKKHIYKIDGLGILNIKPKISREIDLGLLIKEFLGTSIISGTIFLTLAEIEDKSIKRLLVNAFTRMMKGD